jgi:hypothetical protein
MASQKIPLTDKRAHLTTQAAYRVVAFGHNAKVISEHFLYSENLAQIQLDILLKEQQYCACRIMLYNPDGEIVFAQDPKD